MSLDESLKKAIDEFMTGLKSIEEWNALSEDYQQKIKDFCDRNRMEICAFILLLNLYSKKPGASGFGSELNHPITFEI